MTTKPLTLTRRNTYLRELRRMMSHRVMHVHHLRMYCALDIMHIVEALGT